MTIFLSISKVTVVYTDNISKQLNNLVNYYSQFGNIKVHTINPLYSIDTSFYYNIIVNKHIFIDSICHINMFDYNFMPLLQEYQHVLFIFITKLLCSNLFKLSLAGTIILLYNYILNTVIMLARLIPVVCNVILVRLTQVVYFLLTIIKLLMLHVSNINMLGKIWVIMFLILVFSTFVTASSTNVISLDSIFIILASVGNLFYFMAGIVFDYLSYMNGSNNSFINDNPFISKFILGLIYLFYVLLGVFSSNGLWFYTSARFSNLLPGAIASGFSTVVFSLMWYALTPSPNIESYVLINSIFRALSECIAFNSVSWHTYYLWDLWNYNVNSPNILAIALFIPLHLVSSFFTVYAEVSGDIYPLVYGIAYYISFGAGCLGVNALYSLILHLITTNLTTTITISIASITTAMLYPNIYRNMIPSNTVDIELNDINRVGNINRRVTSMDVIYNNIRYIILSVIRYFLLIVSFILVSGLLYSFIS